MGGSNNPDRYPVLRRLLEAEYGSINNFIRASGLPRASVILTLKGKYGNEGTDDTPQRERIEAFLRKDRPGLDLSGLWAETRRVDRKSTIVLVAGKKLRITTVTTIELLEE